MSQEVMDFAAQVTDSSKARLFKGLEIILPPITPGVTRAPIRLRDTQYNEITDWCKSNGFIEWGKRPRTLVVLHIIGCPDAMDSFVNADLSDIAFPYSEENLPSVISGSQREQFLDYQHHVLTSCAADIERGGGAHQHIDGDADQFFWLGKELGNGGFGKVDEVYGRLTLHRFARKRIARGRTFNRDRVKLRDFGNELSNLKRLSHRHLVKLIGSYTDKTYVGFLMTPVADMDLDTYLASNDIDPVDKKNCLRMFFGCLATAVEYLHKQKIRHKDIKPKNILIYNKKVLLADFGTSHNWHDDGKATTEGTNRQGVTKAYCAPEVANYGVWPAESNRIKEIC